MTQFFCLLFFPVWSCASLRIQLPLGIVVIVNYLKCDVISEITYPYKIRKMATISIVTSDKLNSTKFIYKIDIWKTIIQLLHILLTLSFLLSLSSLMLLSKLASFSSILFVLSHLYWFLCFPCPFSSFFSSFFSSTLYFYSVFVCLFLFSLRFLFFFFFYPSTFLSSLSPASFPFPCDFIHYLSIYIYIGQLHLMLHQQGGVSQKGNWRRIDSYFLFLTICSFFKLIGHHKDFGVCRQNYSH